MERKNGKIVNTASTCANQYEERLMAYCCSKAAVQHFSKSLARTLAPYNINVNILNPSVVYTPGFAVKSLAQQRRIHPEQFAGKTDKEYIESMVLPRIPLGRLATPEDMGHMVAFLFSEDAKNITGQNHYVGGGLGMS